jgi:hypothetical protein
MRHVVQTCAVKARARRMIEASNPARLVAYAGLTYRRRSGLLCTGSCAIDMATIAVAAHQHLGTATRAQEESTRDVHRRHMSCRSDIDRKVRSVEQSPCTRVRHAVGHGIGHAWRLTPVSCLFCSAPSFLPHVALCCHPLPNFMQGKLQISRFKNPQNIECVYRNKQAFRYRGCNFQKR